MWSRPIPDRLLSGVRVLDLTDHRGLVAGRLLADLGADVVIVEPVEGAPSRGAAPLLCDAEEPSAYWATFAANRRSVCVDDIRPLVEAADIIVLSGRPIDLAERGHNPEDILAMSPAAVVVAITPFGRTGPKCDYEDTDLILWAAGGPLEPHRAELDGAPVRMSIPQAYLHAGADAAGAALLGYLAAQRDGEGQIVDVCVQASLSQATLARVLSVPVGDPRAHAPQQPLTGLDRSGSGAATSGSFKKWHCRDGLVELHLAMGPSSGRFTNNFFEWVASEGAYPEYLPRWDWPTLPDAIGRGEFTNDDLDAVRAVTRDFLAMKTRAEVTQAAIQHRLLCVGINEIADVDSEPHFAERELWSEPAPGEARLVEQWVHVSDALGPSVARPAPAVGAHTREVLAEWVGES